MVVVLLVVSVVHGGVSVFNVDEWACVGVGGYDVVVMDACCVACICGDDDVGDGVVGIDVGDVDVVVVVVYNGVGVDVDGIGCCYAGVGVVVVVDDCGAAANVCDIVDGNVGVGVCVGVVYGAGVDVGGVCCWLSCCYWCVLCYMCCQLWCMR